MDLDTEEGTEIMELGEIDWISGWDGVFSGGV
jgi:hypothetical protein